MGEIVKKILGDVDSDPEYRDLTIEFNANGKVHFHIQGLRIDMTCEQYNTFCDAVLEARSLLSEKCKTKDS
ncbi:MAG: hypothetical protein KDD55_10420 [Bdellovibrionales bacterium]|nr:hypothetical protein [Bdellovibrionales bacterium]